MAFNFWDIVPYWEIMLFVILPVGLLMILIAKVWSWIKDFTDERRERKEKLAEERAGEKGKSLRMRIRERFWGIDLMRVIVGILCLLPLLIFVDYLFGGREIDIYTEMLINWLPMVWILIVAFYLMASIPYVFTPEEG